MDRRPIPPWAVGPAELFRHADGHFVGDGDTDRRLALIGFDNAIEVCVDTFVGLHPRHRGGYEIRREDREPILRTYHTKVEFLERYAAERGVSLGSVSIDDIVWYHQLRNELYHSGNGMTPERAHLVAIREAARSVFQALFNCDVIAAPSSADSPTQPPPTPPTVRSDELAFLSAYIGFEHALARWSKPSNRRYLPQMWQEYRARSAWAIDFDELVVGSRVVRNVLVHGEDRTEFGIGDATLEQLARRLGDLTALVSTRPPGLRSSDTSEERSGRKLAEAAHKAATEMDPARKGLSSLEITDRLVERGLRIRGENPGRTAYDALNVAHDLFEHAPGGRYRWRPRQPRTDGLSGMPLLEAIQREALWLNEEPRGRHYQEIVARLEGIGISVKGPDKGRTVNAALNGAAGRRSFSRVARGHYRSLEQG